MLVSRTRADSSSRKQRQEKCIGASSLRDGRSRPCVFGGCSLAGLAETKVFRMLISLKFQMLKLRCLKCFTFVNSLNSARAIKMQICSWCASGNAQESQGFIFLNCPNRQVAVGFFFTTEDGKTQFKSIKNLTRLDYYEAQQIFSSECSLMYTRNC